MVLDNVKIMLGIKDSEQDALLAILIKNVTNHLLGRLKKVDPDILGVPEEIEYIIEEITVRRFNRVGTEGMKSESVEGHTVSFYDLRDEFVPYDEIINGYAAPGDKSKGRALFF